MKHLAQIHIKSMFGTPFSTTRGKNIGDLISLILKISFVVAGIFILFMFIIAGFSMISGAGKSDPEKTKKSQQALTSAMIGFVIIFVAYWIIRLLELIINIPFITNPGI